MSDATRPALDARLSALADEWAAHCERVRHSSNPADYLDHPSFRALVAAGPAAVPWVMNRYEADGRVPWEYAVERITGVTMIDDPVFVDMADAARRRLAWWAGARPTWPGIRV